MNFEKLGLILFIKYVRQFEAVKQHLTNSLKELLLAASSTLDITNEITGKNLVLKRIPTLGGTFKRIGALLEYSIEQLDGPTKALKAPPKREDGLKQSIVESILMVIDEETDVLVTSDALNKELKIEALTTVKRVLSVHLDDKEPMTLDYVTLDETSNL